MTVLPFPAPPQLSKQTRRQRQATKRITLRQARCLMDGLSFAAESGVLLNTHLIIHWGGTVAGDQSRRRSIREIPLPSRQAVSSQVWN